MSLGTDNVKTPNSSAELSTILDELRDIKIDFVTMCVATRKKKTSMKWYDSSEVMPVKAEDGVGGAGFIVLKSLTSRVISLEIISHRFAFLKLRVNNSSTMKVHPHPP